MPRGGARPGAGRRKGQKSKATLAREEAMQQAAAKIEGVIPDPFEGDAHALLIAIYKDPSYSTQMRVDAAKAAIRFEKPPLAATAPNDGSDAVADAAREVPRDTGLDITSPDWPSATPEACG